MCKTSYVALLGEPRIGKRAIGTVASVVCVCVRGREEGADDRMHRSAGWRRCARWVRGGSNGVGEEGHGGYDEGEERVGEC